jgi:hypothetical protein
MDCREVWDCLWDSWDCLWDSWDGLWDSWDCLWDSWDNNADPPHGSGFEIIGWGGLTRRVKTPTLLSPVRSHKFRRSGVSQNERTTICVTGGDSPMCVQQAARRAATRPVPGTPVLVGRVRGSKQATVRYDSERSDATPGWTTPPRVGRRTNTEIYTRLRTRIRGCGRTAAPHRTPSRVGAHCNLHSF